MFKARFKTYNFVWMNPKELHHKLENFKVHRFLGKILGTEGKKAGYLIVHVNEENRMWWRIHGKLPIEVLDYIKETLLTNSKRN